MKQKIVSLGTQTHPEHRNSSGEGKTEAANVFTIRPWKRPACSIPDAKRWGRRGKGAAELGRNTGRKKTVEVGAETFSMSTFLAQL